VVNRIEENVSSARDNVNTGAVTLSKITKNAALPLIGAGVGMAVAGPIGLFLGYKLAAVAAVGTASAGYFGGKVVQKVTNPPVLMVDNKDNTVKEVDARHEEEMEVEEAIQVESKSKKKKRRR